MGCAEGRSSIKKEEERGIANNEMILGFEKTTIDDADLIIRKYALNHELTDA